MAEYDPEPRSAGPSVVTRGRLVRSAILVLDPAGAAKHDDIPASWHPMSLHHLVVWCRLPVEHSLEPAERALAELSDQHAKVDLLTCGPTTALAMDFALNHADAVRAVLLVDPSAPHDQFGGNATAADARWEERSWERLAELGRAGVAVKIVAHSAGGSRDRVPPPLPLGHPDLVELVRSAITELESEDVEGWSQPGSEGS